MVEAGQLAEAAQLLGPLVRGKRFTRPSRMNAESVEVDEVKAWLRDAIAELHADVRYIPNSASGPVSGGGPYSLRSPRFYFEERATTKLHSELGMPNIVGYESLRQMMPERSLWPQGLDWGLHDFNLTGAQALAGFVRTIDETFGGAADASEWVRLARDIGARGVKVRPNGLPEGVPVERTLEQIGRALAECGAVAADNGVQIWVDDVNSRGGIEVGGKKRKVELVILDDRSDKQLVPRVYETLIKDEKVDLVFGPFGSTLTAAAANTTEANNKFMVIWSASADSIYKQGYKYIVSATQIAGTLLGQPAVRALHSMGVKKIAFAYVDEPFPAALTQGAIDLAKKLGMQVTMDEKFAKGTKDFNILIQKAKASGADAFYPTAYEGDQMTIARQIREWKKRGLVREPPDPRELQ